MAPNSPSLLSRGRQGRTRSTRYSSRHRHQCAARRDRAGPCCRCARARHRDSILRELGIRNADQVRRQGDTRARRGHQPRAGRFVVRLMIGREGRRRGTTRHVPRWKKRERSWFPLHRTLLRVDAGRQPTPFDGAMGGNHGSPQNSARCALSTRLFRA